MLAPSSFSDHMDQDSQRHHQDVPKFPLSSNAAVFPTTELAHNNVLQITWTMICNGVHKSCTSDTPCDLVIDCATPINSLNGWSPN